MELIVKGPMHEWQIIFFSQQIALPNSPPWFAIFNVEENHIHEICLTILKLYARPRVSYFILASILRLIWNSF